MSVLDHIFRLHSGGVLGNRYRLDRCLGDGTYGFVWKAERLSDHQTVAIKIPKYQGGRNTDIEEGKALIGAEPHPNLVSVNWMGRIPPEHELFAIELEFFNSHTLAFVFDNQGDRLALSSRSLLRLFEQVLDGVCHLHSLGVTHGDIKPQNILVSGDVAKLTDYGSSLTTHDIYLRTRENGGTVLYSPPEMAGLSVRKKDPALAVAHDIYSLGVLLYQLLTGRLPHDTLAQVVRHSPFPRPAELSASIVEDLDDVVMRALQRRPEDRWSSAEAMRKAFLAAKHFQSDHSSSLVRDVQAERATDWSSRVISFMEQEAWRDAEIAAGAEFRRSGDAHAFLLMVRSAARDSRYFDVLRILDEYPEMLIQESVVVGDLELLSLEALLRTERINDAAVMVDRCIKRQLDNNGLLLRKASILGLQARFIESAQILISLNQRLPHRRAILQRLVLVHEQLRDTQMADAFRKALAKLDITDQAALS